MVLRPTAHDQSEEMIWDSLKRAIANSSGFQRWHSERMGGEPPADRNLDQLVSRYLRETLETLAY